MHCEHVVSIIIYSPTMKSYYHNSCHIFINPRNEFFPKPFSTWFYAAAAVVFSYELAFKAERMWEKDEKRTKLIYVGYVFCVSCDLKLRNSNRNHKKWFLLLMLRCVLLKALKALKKGWRSQTFQRLLQRVDLLNALRLIGIQTTCSKNKCGIDVQSLSTYKGSDPRLSRQSRHSTTDCLRISLCLDKSSSFDSGRRDLFPGILGFQ